MLLLPWDRDDRGQEMSHGFFPAPESIVRDIGPSQAVLYGRIWRYCQGGGTCYASLGTLASECNASPSTVKRWIGELAAAGYVRHTSGRLSGTTSVLTTTRKWIMGADSDDALQGRPKRPTGVGQNRLPGRPKQATGVGQNDLRLKELEEKREEKKKDASPFGVVVVAPRPAPPDHDDDAGHASSAVDYPEASEALDTIAAILAASPCRNPEGRALIAWSAIRHAAPAATATDIRAAADDWTERWTRIKGHAPDPLQASQLPDVVAGWMKSTTTASRAGHGLVPVIER